MIQNPITYTFRAQRAVQLGQSCDRAFGLVCDRLGLDRAEAIKAPLVSIAEARAAKEDLL